MVRLASVALAGILLPASAVASNCAARLSPPALADVPSRSITAADLIELRDFGPPDGTPGNTDLFAVSPDGKMAALVLRRADVATNSYCFGVMLVALDGGRAWLADAGGEPIMPGSDFRQAEERFGTIDNPVPRWSPDGRTIAFLRRDSGVTRLWTVRVAGGAAKPITQGPQDVRRFRWSRDGRSLLYRVRPQVTEARAVIAEEGRSGYLYDLRFWPMSEAAPRPLPGIPFENRAVELATGVNRLANADETASIEDRPPTSVPGDATVFARGGDGNVAWSAPRVANTVLGPERLVAERSGRRFECLGDACAKRIIGLWWAGPSRLVFLRDWSGDGAGAVELFSWTPGSAPVSILRTQDALMDCQMTGPDLICGVERSKQPRHIERIDLSNGRRRQVFDPNPEFAAVQLGQVTRVIARASDGTGGFADLVLPPDHQTGQRHPLVIVQYQSRGFLRAGTGDDYPIFLLAARGYAVLSFQRTAHFSNGAKFSKWSDLLRINTDGWRDRTRVFTALQSAVDAAIATGAVDPDKIGITGMSDGASTAVWAILRDPRYRVAAISQCCEDPYPSFYGNGLGYRSDVESWGYPAPEHDEKGFWRFYSLAAHAETLNTPILMQIADREYRFALQGIGALKAAGKPVELYVFPNEYHNKVQPEHRAAIYRRTIAWFDFWLRGDPAPAHAVPSELGRWRAMRSAAAPGPL
jgi:dipeptidyl aminopeptidase/acylaminoacyl peptidase